MLHQNHYGKKCFHDQEDGMDYMSLDARKPVFGVSDQVRHKSVYTVTGAG